MERRLRHHAIDTVAQLCAANVATLRAAWGSIEGERLHGRLRGEEVAAPPSRRASISHSHVLPPALRNPDAAYSVLHRLLQKAAMRLRSYGLIAGNVQVRVNYRNEEVWRADQPVDPTANTLAFLHALTALWHTRPANRTPYAVAVALTLLDDAAHQTLNLFTDGHTQAQHDKLNAALDAINLRYGKNALYFGGAHRALAAAPMRIAFQHIPDLDIEADV